MVRALDFGNQGLGVRIHPGVSFLNMMQARLATCCKFATGPHIVGCGICAVWECIKTVSSWTLVAGKADQTIDMQNTQTFAKHIWDTVEILVSLKLLQTGKPDEAEVATNQDATSPILWLQNII